MDAAQLKDDVRSRRIDVDRLVELVVMLLGQLQQTREERRQEARGKKKRRKRKPRRRGRKRTAEKVALAERTEKVFPQGMAEHECDYSHTRTVWRLENGRAVLVAYEIHRAGNRFGKIPGVPDRGEFGIEISVAIAYQVYVVGLSFDKVCVLMNFFQGLTLTKSQADALLKRLAKQWEREFDVLCTLLAHSAVVHADETGWSIRSVWAFLSEKARVLFFGVHKDAATHGDRQHAGIAASASGGAHPADHHRRTPALVHRRPKLLRQSLGQAQPAPKPQLPPQPHPHRRIIALAHQAPKPRANPPLAGACKLRVEWTASKAGRVGTAIADLTVCGALPPYNEILGGKLVAAMMASPEVVREYRRSYGETPSVIASSMAGKTVVRPAELVFIGTRSLYGRRPSQYDRISIPLGMSAFAPRKGAGRSDGPRSLKERPFAERKATLA
jgi:Druantia protein DruA